MVLCGMNYADLELTESGLPLIQSIGIKGVCHCTWQVYLLIYVFPLVFLAPFWGFVWSQHLELAYC